MTICIGENIKKLRLRKEITQETLAEFLGVSFQSVSRWERSESYPDITLLPSIASFFDVTVDFLLSTGKEHNEEKIRKYLDAYDNMKLKDSALTFEKFEGAVKEFPGDFRILVRYMELLHEEKLFNQPWNELVSGSYKKISEKIGSIYEKIQKHCTDDDIRIRSKRIMITHLLWMYDCACDETGKFLFNKEYLDRAKDIAATLPAMCDSRELMLISDKENYRQVNKAALEELIFQLQSVLFGYCFDRSTEERIKQYEATQSLLELVYPDGSFGKNSFNRLYSYGHLGHLYHEAGDDKKALENLSLCADYAIKLDSQPDETEQIKRFYNYGTAYREMNAREFVKTVMTEHYPLSDEFKNNKEFKKIIKKLG